jgi:hypothetical protein
MYANKTTVRPDRTKAEIAALLVRYGAESVLAGWDGKRAMVGFQKDGKVVRINLAFPDRKDDQFTKVKRAYGHVGTRSTKEGDNLYDQEIRRRWRALLLVIKAKLEAVESGITTFEQEFLAHLVTPDGTTVGEWAAPQLERMYKNNRMPPLLPGAGGTSG